VLHTHSRAGVAVSAQKHGMLPISQQAPSCWLAGLPRLRRRRLPRREKPRLQADLGSANFLMLRNHGLLTVGKTIADAFLSMYTFENTCRIQVDAQAGGELNLIGPGPLAANANVGNTATRRPGLEPGLARAAAQAGQDRSFLQDLMSKLVGAARVRRWAAGAHTVAVYASLRLHCGARFGVAPQNSLRAAFAAPATRCIRQNNGDNTS
jgi:rhamnose utilization protein RhaD (predicted bifunctional aldolase and dehydrogenase)